MDQFSLISSVCIAQRVAGKEFAPDSPIGNLYNSSVAKGDHYEGPAALAGVLEFVRELRISGDERTSPQRQSERVQAALEFARSVFANIPEVEAVVFYGSALRGKVGAKDFDTRLVTAHAEIDDMERMYPVMNDTQQRVLRAFDSNVSIPKQIAGLPVQVMVNCQYADTLGMELSYVEGGPYLAILRGASTASSFREPCPMFLNTSGREYLQARAA